MSVSQTAGFGPESMSTKEGPCPVYKALRTSEPVLPFDWRGKSYWILTQFKDIDGEFEP
jgi:hypothetical protein